MRRHAGPKAVRIDTLRWVPCAFMPTPMASAMVQSKATVGVIQATLRGALSQGKVGGAGERGMRSTGLGPPCGKPADRRTRGTDRCVAGALPAASLLALTAFLAASQLPRCPSKTLQPARVITGLPRKGSRPEKTDASTNLLGKRHAGPGAATSVQALENVLKVADWHAKHKSP